MKTLFQIYAEEFAHIQYCCYCMETKGDRLTCCDEADWIEFKDLDIEDQRAIIDEELNDNF